MSATNLPAVQTVSGRVKTRRGECVITLFGNADLPDAIANLDELDVACKLKLRYGADPGELHQPFKGHVFASSIDFSICAPRELAEWLYENREEDLGTVVEVRCDESNVLWYGWVNAETIRLKKFEKIYPLVDVKFSARDLAALKDMLPVPTGQTSPQSPFVGRPSMHDVIKYLLYDAGLGLDICYVADKRPANSDPALLPMDATVFGGELYYQIGDPTDATAAQQLKDIATFYGAWLWQKLDGSGYAFRNPLGICETATPEDGAHVSINGGPLEPKTVEPMIIELEDEDFDCEAICIGRTETIYELRYCATYDEAHVIKNGAFQGFAPPLQYVPCWGPALNEAFAVPPLLDATGFPTPLPFPPPPYFENLFQNEAYEFPDEADNRAVSQKLMRVCAGTTISLSFCINVLLQQPRRDIAKSPLIQIFVCDPDTGLPIRYWNGNSWQDGNHAHQTWDSKQDELDPPLDVFTFFERCYDTEFEIDTDGILGFQLWSLGTNERFWISNPRMQISSECLCGCCYRGQIPGVPIERTWGPEGVCEIKTPFHEGSSRPSAYETGIPLVESIPVPDIGTIDVNGDFTYVKDWDNREKQGVDCVEIMWCDLAKMIGSDIVAGTICERVPLEACFRWRGDIYLPVKSPCIDLVDETTTGAWAKAPEGFFL